LPVFAATIFIDKKTWFWKYGLPQEALLISYDVLLDRAEFLNRPLADTLRFSGLIVVDSGAFGRTGAADAETIYEGQYRVRADIAVALDHVASQSSDPTEQWNHVRNTVANAAKAARLNGKRPLAIEGVVQGATTSQRTWCARQLSGLNLRVYGVPVSHFSKYRQYDEAAKRVLEAISILPRKSLVHAMGAGSRTTMAVLSYFGADIFDSTSWFSVAAQGEKLKPVTLCIFDRPKGKPECDLCQSSHGRVRSTQGRARHNLLEIFKEMTRIRCAQEEGVMRHYLDLRLQPSSLKRLAVLLDTHRPPP
jgi:7-cyano-7-deazaguanine tRNA-ribosyltransferase